MSKEISFRQYRDGDWFADIDGKRIARKSIFKASVEDSQGNTIAYNSHIEHCGSCIADDQDGYSDFDYTCCCVHRHFKSKKEENTYLDKIGFWKIPFQPTSTKQEEKE